ncbi:MAG TPA: hypothetical protein VGD18_03805, partial [Thiobacillaceae bacterium]
MRGYNRLLVAFYVITDALLGMASLLVAYWLRFKTGLIPVTKGYPPIDQYLQMLPFLAVLVPLAFHIQGLYRLRRGRSRVDDFFAVLVGSVLAAILGLVALLYYQAYYLANEAILSGTYHEASRVVLVLFLFVNVVFTYGSREMVREALERRWKAGIGLKR